MTPEQLAELKKPETKPVPLPNGETVEITMSNHHWEEVRFLEIVEGITQQELSQYALEESQLQNIDFEEAYRCVVAYLASQWT